ncbi:hypothetical protein P5673_032782 [Acropora cervicornis]|uniref:Thiaminase-2/PQQC domain-containing protein n=1 Tax=Acropora cervicornis TaxID=6130 RepID=A0AAD9PR61_ACRCE|nr:hypothetical protein P5673_032782 [Acropora cervicornis]
MNRDRQQGTKWQLKKLRKMILDTSFLPAETLQSAQPSFSQELFNNETSVKIRNAAKESMFIQGMASGTLDPDDYGGYMVQDAAYCFNAVEAFDVAANKIQSEGKPEFALLYRVQSESYKKYNQEFVKVWQLKSTESIVMGPAAATYVDYESVLSRQDPKYLAIAMLPCTMLWPWIAGELIDSVHKDNPYYDWFAENKPDGHKSRLEEFVDYFFNAGDKAKSLVIFHEGLVNELNFFRNACDQTLYYYSSFNV